jgi:hypothetical protein
MATVIILKKEDSCKDEICIINKCHLKGIISLFILQIVNVLYYRFTEGDK